MKLLLITDQHFGVRNDNKHFINHYKKFYGKVVIPFIKAHNIEHIFCLGDTFDKRKSINFNSLDECREMWFDPLREMGVRMDMLVGNHDIYYKNTLRVNAPDELLGEYHNIHVIKEPTNITYDDLDVLCLPWICDDNLEETFRAIKQSKSTVCMGHLELNGFEAHPGHVMERGMDHSVFKKFKKVFTGHYHSKSHKDNIYYLEIPTNFTGMTSDVKEAFHVFDTTTLKTTHYRNPFDVFVKLYYNNGVSLPNERDVEGTFVKLIVEDKGDYAKFDYAVKRLQDMNIADLKIVEDLSIAGTGVDVLETEDTLTLLDTYIDEIDLQVSKDNVKSVMRSLYMEASAI